MTTPRARLLWTLLVPFLVFACSGDGDPESDANTNGESKSDASTSSDSGNEQATVACRPGLSCSEQQYCAWDEYEVCGGSGDEQGTCEPRPSACDDVYAPVCGCDEVVYSSRCEAASAGIDVGGTGCEPPEGLFACGAEFCDPVTHYCHETIWDGPTERECRAIPPECSSTPDCVCLQQSFEDYCGGDGPSCKEASGGLVLTDCHMG